MTHDELLAKLSSTNRRYAGSQDNAALRAVVELHTAGNGEASRCEACWIGIMDCPTIQAI